MKKLALLLLFVVVAPSLGLAQNALLQGGPMTSGHGPMYVSQGTSQAVVQDSGPAGGGGLGLGYSELLLTVRGSGNPPYANAGTGPFGTNACDYDAPITNPTGYHVLCFSPNANGGGLISYGYGGGASPLPFAFNINGVTLFPATLPSAATNQLYGGSGTAGIAAVVSLGSGLNLTAGVLTATATASLPVAATNQLYGGSGTAGLANVVTLGSGLSLVGGVLTSTGGGGTPGGLVGQLQWNNTVFAGTSAITTNGIAQLMLGGTASTVGQIEFGGLTSGFVTLQATSGPLGSSVLLLPAVTDTLAVLGNINTALPSATTSQLYGGTGAAGIAGLVNIGSGLALTTGTLSATGGSGGTGTAQRATFCASAVWITGTCQPTAFTPGTTSAITLPFTPTSASAVWVWTDAGYADAYTYVISGTTLTFNAPINAQTQVIEVTAGVASGGFAPGGAAGDVQFNATTFGGNSGFVYDGTSVISLGVAGSSTGAVQLANTTSGTLTLRPPTTGALGANVLTLPIGTTTLAGLGLVQSWSAAQTFANNDLAILGTSSGATTIASANSSASNYTATLPPNTGIVAELNLAQTWSAVQTHVNNGINLLGSSTGTTTFASANGSATNYTITFPASTGTVLTTAAAITVPQGGTGDSSLPAYAPLFGGTTTTAPIQSTALGTAGQVLTSNGAGALATFQTPSASSAVYFDIVAYGCVASTSTSSADQSSCIQSAENAANSAGGGVVFVPGGFWNLKAQIYAPPFVKILGTTNGATIAANGSNVATIAYGTANGSMFAVLWGNGTGNSNSTAFTALLLDDTSEVNSVGWWYPSQSPASSTPTEYGATIGLKSTLAALANLSYSGNQSVINNYCANCYVFADFRGSQIGYYLVNYKLNENFGAPIAYGFKVNQASDFGEIDNNLLNAGYLSDDVTGLRTWMANNGVVVYLGFGDSYHVHNMQTFGYNVGVYLDGSTSCCGTLNGVLNPVTIDGSQFDGLNYDVYQVGAVGSVRLDNNQLAAYNSLTNALGGVYAMAPSATLSVFQMTDNNQLTGAAYMFGYGGSNSVIYAVVDGNIAGTTGSGNTCYKFPGGTTLIITSNTCWGGYSTFTTNGTYTNLINANNH